MNEQELISHAKSMLENPLSQKVVDRIVTKAVASFRKGTMEERTAASDLMDNIEMFFNELQIIVDESKPINTANEKILPLKR